MYQLRLYLSGDTDRSKKAVKDLKALLEDKLKDQYFLQIINILDDPEKAEDDSILATPTVVKRSPPPMRRVIGDLSKGESVLAKLGLMEL